jgi:hypothetical protein
MNLKTTTTSVITAILFGAGASACDMCACELPLISLENKKGWHVGVSEQYTRFGSLQMDGHGIADPADQYLNSSITQVFIGYDLTKSLGVQVTVPMIYRSFRRAEGGAVETGDVSGFGDVSLLAHWTPARVERGDFLFTGRLLAGIKLPTGDSDRVLEEANEDEGGGPPSGVHGHDLALGTGSVDGIIGADLHMQWKRAFLDAGIEFVARGDGRHDYDFADDLNWRTSAGAVALKGKDFNLALAVEFAGGTKGEDVFRGVRASDTSATVIYMGPRVIATWRERLHADVAVSFPIVRENSGVQSVPDYRIQASVGWQF